MAQQTQLPRTGRIYVLAVAAVGLATVVGSAYSLWVQPPTWTWLLFAAFTTLSARFNIELPEINTTFSVSEIFVFAAVLLYGAPAATIIVALDGLLLLLWLRFRRPNSPALKSPERFLFNVAEPALSIWLASQLFFRITNLQPITVSHIDPNVVPLLAPIAVLAGTYFLFNSSFVAVGIGFQRRQSPIPLWWKQHAPLSLNYFCGAMVATVLVRNSGNHLDWVGLLVIPPFLIILIVTQWYFGKAEVRRNALLQKQQALLETQRELLETEREVNQLNLSIISALANAIDAKDQITHDHIQRVQVWAFNLAKALGVSDKSTLDAIYAAALLHDTGKLGVPEYILNKPGKLTPAEFEKMKRHSVVGAEILSKVPFKYPVVPIVRHHHENWDGTGYPDRLKGSDIPLGARILAVVDCFDALTSDRPYRARLDEVDAFKILTERRGTMYDPAVVDKFLDVYSVIGPPESNEPGSRDIDLSNELNVPAHEPTTTGGLSDIAASSDEMLTLYDLSRALSGRTGLADAGDVIAKHLRRLLPATVCIFYSYDQGSDELVVAHVVPDTLPVVGTRVPNGHGIAGWVAANRRTITNCNPALDLGDIATQATPALLSCLSTPLLIDDSLVGVLSVCSTNAAAFTDDHRRLIEAVEQQISRVVRDSSVFDLRTAEYTDPLTGLPNIERLQQLTSVEGGLGSDKGLQPLSVLFLRIRWAGADSDSAGSTAAALAQLAMTVRRVLRAGDILFRYADDQFVVMLSQTDAETAASIAQRVRSVVASTGQGDSKSGVSVSVTSATFPVDGTSLADLVGCASRRASNLNEPTLDQGTIH